MVTPNWELRGCCNRNQNAFLITIGIFTVVILLLWRTFLLTPFKLITVFLHEASHAVACKLTCGDVEGMEVNANEGGSTTTRGGIYWLILPAGCNPHSIYLSPLYKLTTTEYGVSPFEYALGESGGSLQLAIVNAQVKWPNAGPKASYPEALHQFVTWMLQPQPAVRPSIDAIIIHVDKLIAKFTK
ncbi:hypothetical protein F2Q68_00008450 [Brassica cretica]|uniref:Uncharacterized protein n=1 Tax=Brassica cretica TaxID=69181 RepID=A0A8S9KV56_BRACR|nr:hypothetical protein F2Q68_00008450 [Brassica cretica]